MARLGCRKQWAPIFSLFDHIAPNGTRALHSIAAASRSSVAHPCIASSTSAGVASSAFVRSIRMPRSTVPPWSKPRASASNKRDVIEHIVIAAAIELAGAVRRLAVSVQRMANGTIHYDFHTDKRFAGGPGIGARLALRENSPDSLESTADDLNLFLWSDERNSGPRAFQSVPVVARHGTVFVLRDCTFLRDHLSSRKNNAKFVGISVTIITPPSSGGDLLHMAAPGFHLSAPQ